METHVVEFRQGINGWISLTVDGVQVGPTYRPSELDAIANGWAQVADNMARPAED